jgi:hypothetical protein
MLAAERRVNMLFFVARTGKNRDRKKKKISVTGDKRVFT